MVGGIAWARRRIAGLQAVGCQDCLRVGLPTGGIAYGWDCRMRDCLPHAGLPAMGLLLAGCPCRIACVGLRVCRRLEKKLNSESGLLRSAKRAEK